jgi:sugar lactone lactonase YvrE
MVRILKSDAARNPANTAPRIEAVLPDSALPGGEIEVRGANLGTHMNSAGLLRPLSEIGGAAAPVLLSRDNRLVVRVPEVASASPRLEVFRNGSRSNQVEVHIARLLAENVHAVASPAVNDKGEIFVTFSGPRGQQTPVSVFKIDPDGEMHVLLSGLVNATALALDAYGYLYVSSRHEGTVHRVSPQGAAAIYAEGMGVATGVAFDASQNLYVGDRSGTIFKIARDRQTFVFATLEPSVAAYHMAFGPDGGLYVTGPTTSSYDSVHRIDPDGSTSVYYRGLGRPQGIAVDIAGNLYIAASLRGRRGIVRVTPDKEASLVLAGSGLIGLAFAPGGNAVLTTGTAVYHVDLGVEGFRFA